MLQKMKETFKLILEIQALFILACPSNTWKWFYAFALVFISTGKTCLNLSLYGLITIHILFVFQKDDNRQGYFLKEHSWETFGLTNIAKNQQGMWFTLVFINT